MTEALLPLWAALVRDDVDVALDGAGDEDALVVQERPGREAIWDPADFITFKAFRTLFLKKALVAVPGGVQGLAIGIDHPELKEMGVRDVVVKSISPVLNDGFGVWSCKVTFLQFRKPAPAVSKPDAAFPDNGTPRPTAKDQQDVTILSLKGIVQSLKGQ